MDVVTGIDERIKNQTLHDSSIQYLQKSFDDRMHCLNGFLESLRLENAALKARIESLEKIVLDDENDYPRRSAKDC